jgi:hypothetical protein
MFNALRKCKMFVKITNNYQHTGEDIIADFTSYREVKVRHCDGSMINAEPNCCIDNSKDLAAYADMLSVKGFISLDGRLGIFHYWNYCEDTDIFWDSTPNTERMRYYVKAQN